MAFVITYMYFDVCTQWPQICADTIFPERLLLKGIERGREINKYRDGHGREDDMSEMEGQGERGFIESVLIQYFQKCEFNYIHKMG